MQQRSAREHFDRQATHYDGQWNAWSEESLAWLIQHGEFSRNDRVLDVATGTGFTALAVAPLVASVIGIDVSSGMLHQARERARETGCSNAGFHQSPAESLTFPDRTFEAITCRMAAHHFDSVPRFLSESHRVLVPGGRLLIADTTVADSFPELDQWQNRVETLRDSSHKRNYSPGEWRTMVSQAGFDIEAIDSHSGAVPITLNAWIRKGGCTQEEEAAVRSMFAAATVEIRNALRIRELEDGDTAFAWLRVVIAARRRPSERCVVRES